VVSVPSVVTASALLVGTAACEPRLPDDLPALIQLMNSNDETISVNSTNKVWKNYGKEGLVRALEIGHPTARARAAFRLRNFANADTEQRLMESAEHDADAFVRTQALWSLQEIGTELALPTVDKATNDRDALAARTAREAAAAIRARLARSPK
jgi:HEAT repeat protein